MKTTTIAMWLAVLLFAGIRMQAENPNLLMNSGVESGNDGWGYYRGGGKGKGEVTDTETHSGKKSYGLKFTKRIEYKKRTFASLYICIGGGDGYKGSKVLKVKPNTTYRFSFWVKGDFPECEVKLQGWKIDDKSAKGRVFSDVKLFKDDKPVKNIKPTNKWSHYSGEFTTLPDMDGAIIKVGTSNFPDDQPKYLFIDDALVTKIH